MGVKTLYVCIDIIIKVGGRIFGFRRGDRNEICLGVGLIWKYGGRYCIALLCNMWNGALWRESRMLWFGTVGNKPRHLWFSFCVLKVHQKKNQSINHLEDGGHPLASMANLQTSLDIVDRCRNCKYIPIKILDI